MMTSAQIQRAAAAFTLGIILMGTDWVVWVVSNGIVRGTLGWLISSGAGVAIGFWLIHRGWHPLMWWVYGKRR